MAKKNQNVRKDKKLTESSAASTAPDVHNSHPPETAVARKKTDLAAICLQVFGVNIKTNPNKPRFDGIDILKILAVFFVAGVHSFLYDGFYYTPIKEDAKWMLVPIAMRWLYFCCVPIFMTVTGYLMVNKKFSGSYYKGLIKIIVLYAAIGLVNILGDYELGTKYDLWTWVKYYVQFEATWYGWYVRFYVALYLLIPFINKCITALEDKKQATIFILTITLLTVFAKSYYWGFTKDNQIRALPDYLADIWPLTYYFFGAYMKKYPPKSGVKTKLIAFAVFALSWGFITFSSFFQSSSSTNADNGFHFTSWHFNFYGSYPMFLMTAAMFVLLYDIKVKFMPLKFILSLVSNTTFALFQLSYNFDRRVYPEFKQKYPDDALGRWTYERWMHVYQAHWTVFLKALLWGLIFTIGYNLLEILVKLIVKKFTAPKEKPQLAAETK